MKKTLLPFLCLLITNLLFSQTYELTVQSGYGGGRYKAGDTVHIWSAEWEVTQTFSHWSGDTRYLTLPGEWHTTVVMPARNVSVKANITSLPVPSANYFRFEQIRGKNILKPVYYYFPAQGAPDAVVWLWHGTGGGALNWVWKDFEMRQYCNYLVANNLAVIITESDESTLKKDMDGDTYLRYNYSLDTVDNWDVANVRAIRDTFIRRGLMTPKTPQVASGFSAGGAFSVAVASFLGWKAAITHNNPGSGYAPVTYIPVRFSITQRDDHPDVGREGNLQAYNNFQTLTGKGQCAQFEILRPSPLYPERFKRIPGITTGISASLTNELAANGCTGAGGYLTKSPNQIEALVAASPRNWPTLLSFSDTVREYIKDELAMMWSSHHFTHDFMAQDVRFIKEQCLRATAVGAVEQKTLLRVFPNPAAGQINLSVQSGRVRIFSAQGLPILERQLSGTGELDVSALPGGIYFLEWKDKERRQVLRWVKL